MPSTRRAYTLGDRAFPVAAARAWNSLPLETRAYSSLLTLWRETKSHLFRQSYGWRGAVYSDGQQTSALRCATVLDLDFCKVPPQLCDGSTLIHDICSSSSSHNSAPKNCKFCVRDLQILCAIFANSAQHFTQFFDGKIVRYTGILSRVSWLVGRLNIRVTIQLTLSLTTSCEGCLLFTFVKEN